MNKRRKSRPVSELITLFDHQQAEEGRIGQWRSEDALNLIKLPTTFNKEKPTTTSSLFRNSAISKSSDSVFSSDESPKKELKQARGEALGKTSIMLTLKPKAGTDKTEVTISSIEPKTKDTKSKEKKPNEKNVPMKVPNDKTKETALQEDGEVETNENYSRKKFPLDDSLAVLRREMHSLRQQDIELMSQLLALNSSIQEFKSNSTSSSMSNFSDISDAETDITEIEAKTSVPHAWHKRDSSGSDASDFETRGYERGRRGRPSKETAVNRDSMDSEVSGYYSNSSPYGSNLSLNGYDVSGGDYSPPSNSPVSCDPPCQHFFHRRQKPWLNQNVMAENGRVGTDPSVNRHVPESGGAILHPAVQSRPYFPGDERVKRISYQQKNISSRRMGSTTCLSRSESEHSTSGYDLDGESNNYASTWQPISDHLQKWQRSKSSCALNSCRRESSPVQNTIKVDLRNNPPMPGTAIELVLPIQPLMPTRRSSAVRMAETKPLNRLNTLNKRQSMIW